MATLKAIQSGTATISAGSSSTTASLTSIDTSKAFLYYTYRVATGSTNIINYGSVAGRITDATTLTFSRYSSTSTPACTISWFVVEFLSGVNVYRGSQAITLTSTNVTITSVDTSKAWARGSYVSSTAPIGLGTLLQCSITGATTLNITMEDGAPANCTAYWEVVEYDNATVALYTKTYAASTTGSTQTITSVTTGKTFLQDSFCKFDDPFGPQNLPDTYLTNATTVTYTLQLDNGNGNNVHKTQVVSISDDVSVQRARTSAGTGTAPTAGISTIATDRTWLKINGAFNTCGGINYNVAGFDRNAFTAVITNSSTLTFTRATGTSTGVISWEAIQMPSGASPRTRVIWVPAI